MYQETQAKLVPVCMKQSHHMLKLRINAISGAPPSATCESEGDSLRPSAISSSSAGWHRGCSEGGFGHHQ
ncbi:MAG: hypothetical protein CM1200mP2_41860 [Planctomycetaceae bacterium]|nr:MAG: hypothetical protein CM1200mP2_41860 [Planctomycetaceae bacterium]